MQLPRGKTTQESGQPLLVLKHQEVSYMKACRNCEENHRSAPQCPKGLCSFGVSLEQIHLLHCSSKQRTDEPICEFPKDSASPNQKESIVKQAQRKARKATKQCCIRDQRYAVGDGRDFMSTYSFETEAISPSVQLIIYLQPAGLRVWQKKKQRRGTWRM